MKNKSLILTYQLLLLLSDWSNFINLMDCAVGQQRQNKITQSSWNISVHIFLYLCNLIQTWAICQSLCLKKLTTLWLTTSGVSKKRVKLQIIKLSRFYFFMVFEYVDFDYDGW